MSNKLVGMARELLAIEDDLKSRLNYSNNGDKPTCDDFEVVSFDQVWGSTALGFGGCGGQAMTSARTYVLVPLIGNQKCFVYFAGQFAYAVPYSETFMDDVRKQNMASVAQSGKYKRVQL